MTYSEIRKNEEVLAFIKKGNANLGAMGFTDHSEAHSGLVAERAAEILKKFGYPEKDIELVKIAGFMHDIGNAVNRSHHAEYGALLANDILKKTDLPLEEEPGCRSCPLSDCMTNLPAVLPIPSRLRR